MVELHELSYKECLKDLKKAIGHNINEYTIEELTDKIKDIKFLLTLLKDYKNTIQNKKMYEMKDLKIV